MRLFTIPNAVSMLRLPLAAAFLITDSTLGRVLVVCAAALSDFADGFLARRIRSHDRRAGELVDPITDKLFILIALITFAVRRELSVGALLIVLVRDLYNSIAFLLLKVWRWPIDFKARLTGKTVTVLQLLLLLALLFWQAAVRPMVWIVGVTSLVAILDYTQAGIRKRRLAGT